MSDVNRSLAESRDALAGPSTPDGGRARLVQAHDAVERACRECGARFDHGIFGTISTADYARFQALHTRHDTKQITGQ